MPRIPLDPADASKILEAATKRFRISIDSLANQRVEKMLEQQKLYQGPMYLRSGEMQLLAFEYRAIVRASAADCAAKLSQAVGNRKGMGKSECDWVEQQVRELAQNWLSLEFGRGWFINAVSSFFTIANEEESTEAFLKGLKFVVRDGHLMADAQRESLINAVSSFVTIESDKEPVEAFIKGLEFTSSDDGLMTDAQTEIRLAAALYGRPQRYQRAGTELPSVTPGEKLRDPINHPVMTVQEAMRATRLSHSSIYRKLAEGPLKRAQAGREPGRRGKCLIQTQSLIDFLEESPD